jgi:hypothetical protein
MAKLIDNMGFEALLTGVTFSIVYFVHQRFVKRG